MKLIEIANAGTLESSDIQIIIEPNENGGIVIELESVVKAQFGEQVEDVIIYSASSGIQFYIAK